MLKHENSKSFWGVNLLRSKLVSLCEICSKLINRNINVSKCFLIFLIFNIIIVIANTKITIDEQPKASKKSPKPLPPLPVNSLKKEYSNPQIKMVLRILVDSFICYLYRFAWVFSMVHNGWVFIAKRTHPEDVSADMMRLCGDT